MHTQPLRIRGIADLQDRVDMLHQVRILDADLIAFCGDLHNDSDRAKAKQAAKALTSLGPPVLTIPRNTDHKDVVLDRWREAGLK
jgi:Icc-related predicted phosphoesterase